VTYYESPAVEAKNTFSYIVMQVIWCLKFSYMTKSGGQSPRSKFWGGGLVPPSLRDVRPCFQLVESTDSRHQSDVFNRLSLIRLDDRFDRLNAEKLLVTSGGS